jgi:hypothetical protein
MRATIRSLGVIAVAALAVAAKGRAQMKVEFTPFAGSYEPTQNLFPEGALAAHGFYGPDIVRQKAGLALGSRVTAWLTRRFAIDGSYGYSGSGVTQTTYSQSTYPCPEVGCPLVAVTSNTTGHIWMASARFLFVVGGRPSNTALYILAGPAYVGHTGDFSGLFCPAEPIYPCNVGEMTSSWGAVVGIGAGLKVPRTALALRVDLEDYLYDTRLSSQVGSTSWSSVQAQNDLVLSLGLSVMAGPTSAR